MFCFFLGRRKSTKQKQKSSSLSKAEIDLAREDDAFWSGRFYKPPKKPVPVSMSLENVVICFIVKERLSFETLPKSLRAKIVHFVMSLYKDCIRDIRYTNRLCQNCMIFKREKCPVCEERQIALQVAEIKSGGEVEEKQLALEMKLLSLTHH